MYRLPDELRPVFQQPFGPVYSTPELLRNIAPRDKVVAVGDIVAKTLIDAGRDPWIIVVDYRTQRHDDDAELRRVLGAWGTKVAKVRNAPATISDELFHALVQALKSKHTTRIEVDGEEDLAGLPVLAVAKTGVLMVYGVPGKGACVVKVDAAVRRRAGDLLERMRIMRGATSNGGGR